MKHQIFSGLAVVLFLTVVAASSGVTQDARQQAMKLPKDVVSFVARRDLCDHFRGEDPYDAPRAAEIEKQLRKNCKGTDADLAHLKKKYPGDTAVQSVLSQYETNIE